MNMITRNLKYCFYYKINEKVGHLQANLNRLHRLPNIVPYNIKEISIHDVKHLEQWIELIADAYGDEKYNIESAKNYFKDHLFLKNIMIYLLFDKRMPIGTISIGIYKDTPHVGGLCRIAVRKEYQGQG